MVMCAASASLSIAQANCPPVGPTGSVQWTTTWCDEFDGALNSPIDTTKWQFDRGNLNVNNEIEFYCAPSDPSPCDPAQPNAYIDGNGHLVIQALRLNGGVSPGSNSWTSARLNTGNNLATFQYGRMESSITLPLGPGLWPAYWSLGTDIGTVGWPASGEMDFMENVPVSGGLGPNAIASTIHGPGYFGSGGLSKHFTLPNGSDVTQPHAYGEIWSPYMVQFYVDDPASPFFVVTQSNLPAGKQWVYNSPFFLLLNLAVGGTGSWPGPPDDTTPSPANMVVDYVRVYQASAIPPPTFASVPGLTIKGGSSATATLSVMGTSGTGLVYLSCSSSTPSATCSINTGNALNPYVVDFSNSSTGSVTLTVATSASASAPSTMGTTSLPGGGVGLSLALASSGAMVLLRRSPATRSFAAGAAILLAVLLLSLVGCGGGGSGGTTSNTATITVNAYTISSNANDSSTYATLSVPVTIQ
jgi:beta-glucanase (GH16 family)